MVALSRNSLIDQAWRFRIENYAHQASNKAWIPYPWLVHLLREVQEQISRGGARIIINAPPRHGKSEGVSHWFPTWFLDWYPHLRVILASYSDSFAAKWGLAVRDEFANNPSTWTRIRRDKSLVTDWATLEGGGMRTVGAGGSVTGMGGDLILVDDPHKNWEEAMSATFRKKVIDWFNATLYTRAEPGASIVVIQTRWHERDLTGYLMNEHEDDWTMISLPALAEKDDPLGRAIGEALCPERFTAEHLLKIKRALGSHMFAGLYQQRPSPLEGGMIKRKWFKRWTELPENMEKYAQSWDLSFSNTGGSYVVGQVWGTKDSKFYLCDQVREQLTFPETVKEILKLSREWPQALSKYVENKANGPALISTLEDALPGIIPHNPVGSKEVRLAAVSGLIEAGDVYVPGDKVTDWAEEFVDEVVTFPNAATDDQVDAMTMALDRLSESSSNLELVLSSSGGRSNPWEFANARP